MKKIKQLIWWLISKVGQPIRDERTGRTLGRALVFTRGGHPWLIGLHFPYVRAVFLPQKHNRYARHAIGFATHESVNFKRLVPAESHRAPRILWAILFHQNADACMKVLSHWKNLGILTADILAIHGGSTKEFEALEHPQKVFVGDPGLRTTQHPVQKQSYSGPLREAARWAASTSHTHVCLMEYDHLPLVPDLGQRLLETMDREGADVLFHHLERVDGTNAPHYLYHLSDTRFANAWSSLSLREDPRVVLNSLATGSFWRRGAFEAVAAHPESFPIYLEMFLPTTAHHLGFRVRAYGSQSQFVSFDPLDKDRLHTAGLSEAWSIHPVKNLNSMTPQP